MSTPTSSAPAGSREPGGAKTGGPAGFGHTVAAEWIKILTVRSTFWTMLAALAVTIGLSVLVALGFVSSYDQVSDADKARFDPAAYGMVGTNFGMVAVAVLGVMVISAEYSTGMIRTSLIAVPNRSRLLAAKAIVVALIVLVVGEIASFTSFFLSQLIFASKNLDGSIGDPGVLRAVVGGGLYLTAIALFSLAVGAILRHTAGAVTTVLGVLLVLPIVGSFLPGEWGDTVARYLPSNAAAAIMNARAAENALGPWTGIGIFVLYTAALFLIAFTLFEKRDA